MSDKAVFTEKQYLGREFIPTTIRVVLALFCFAIYFFTDERETSGNLLLVVGIAIIVISVILRFMLHFSTRVQNKSIFLDGLWTARLVKIDLNSIVKAEKGLYSRYLFNNPVYNLHSRGTIRFYAAGNDAVYLTDRDGLVYIIGSRQSDELLKAILAEMKR
ncbi:MAG: hypothetical protein ABI367_04620 [Mucilaginibacter sp.]